MREKWSKTEKKIARSAFELAFSRECKAVKEHTEDMLKDLTEPENIWKIHDFLDQKKREVDRKYDYRYSVLVLVFTRLIREGWLSEADLEGMREDKLERIKKNLELQL